MKAVAATATPAPAGVSVRARCGKLVVFFSRGMSLEGWHEAGILDRELAIYRELLADSVERLAFVTYGGPGDLAWAQTLPGVEVLPNRWGIAPNLYSVIGPWLHRRDLRDATLFRTNQINGAWSALIAKRLFRKALVVRCGYLWADFMARLTPSPWRRAAARFLERLVLRGADRIVVAADADADRVVDRYDIDRTRITVIPNFVDTTRFRPLPDVAPEPRRVVFIGRLEPQKNVESLIDALATVPRTSLTIVGDGSLRPMLEARARDQGVAADFAGRLPQAELPGVLARAGVFVLPSHFEGNPKVLVEAMACGVPVVGARAPGIREVIVDGETGLLCGHAPHELRSAIERVLDDRALRERLREGGLRYVHQRCSLTMAAARERALLAEMCPA